MIKTRMEGDRGKNDAEDESDENKNDGKHDIGDDKETGKQPDDIKPSDYSDYGEQ